MFKQTFNAISRIHSRAAQVLRRGMVDISSPARLTPSNYSKLQAGPSEMVITGREFIIPVDTLTGQPTLRMAMPSAPTMGDFTITVNVDGDTETTPTINFDDDLAAITAAITSTPGLENAVVTGDIVTGLTILIVGAVLLNSYSIGNTMDVVPTITDSRTPWTDLLKRNDRIVDSLYGSLTIKDLTEIPDLGGAIMGYRVIVE